MRKATRLDPAWISGAVTVVALGVVGFLPLFSGPGYEFALAAGLVLPSAIAIPVALDVSLRRPLPIVGAARAARLALSLSLLAYAIAIAHGLRTELCDFVGGSVYFALTAAAGALLAGAWGVVAGELAAGRRHRRTASVLFALLAPIGGIVVSVARFFGSPMIFAFDPFFGYFSGTLYDTVIEAGRALLTYRLGSLASLAAFALVASALGRGARGRLSLARGTLRSGAIVRLGLGLVAGVASIGVAVNGEALEHYQTSASIARDLGGLARAARCDALFPSAIGRDAGELLARDCDQQVAMVEAALGARGPERITAFFFRDASDKKRLMGAADTYIAKPWRHEVYLQVAPYPHPVLGHELAHVIAGSFGHGPFRIAGTLGGLLPNPGLIEGVAVMASPDEGELSELEWARAMLDERLMPPLTDVFSLSFLKGHSSTSYTVAGAFLEWFRDRFGVAAVRDWYGGAELGAVARGADLATLDVEFRASLQALTIGPEARAYAKARFLRPGLFARKCPHIVDAWKREAEQCRDAEQFEKALRTYGRAIGRDPRDPALRLGASLTKLRAGDFVGRTELEAMAASDDVPRSIRDRSEEALGDDEFLRGRFEAAAVHYETVSLRTVDEDVARTLDVKSFGARSPEARDAILALLIDTKLRGDPLLAGARLGAWARDDASGISAYLIGKNVVQRGHYREGRVYLDQSLATSPLPPRIEREALRQRAIVACALRDAVSVGKLRDRVQSASSPFAAHRGGRFGALVRLLDRCQ